MTHKIKLTNSAVMLLTSALSNTKPGWIQDLKDLAVSSRLLVGKFGSFKPKFSKKKIKEGGEDVDIDVLDASWAKKENEWQFSEVERDKCKACLTTLAKILPPAAPALELIEKFGLEVGE